MDILFDPFLLLLDLDDLDDFDDLDDLDDFDDFDEEDDDPFFNLRDNSICPLVLSSTISFLIPRSC